MSDVAGGGRSPATNARGRIEHDMRARIIAGIATAGILMSMATPALAATQEPAPKTGGGALVFKNSVNSNRMIRVWKDNGCPNTIEGFQRSDVVYEGEFAAFGSVDSIYIAPWRKVHLRYWDNTIITGATGRCVNLMVKPSEVATVKYYRP